MVALGLPLDSPWFAPTPSAGRTFGSACFSYHLVEGCNLGTWQQYKHPHMYDWHRVCCCSCGCGANAWQAVPVLPVVPATGSQQQCCAVLLKQLRVCPVSAWAWYQPGTGSPAQHEGGLLWCNRCAIHMQVTCAQCTCRTAAQSCNRVGDHHVHLGSAVLWCS